MAESIVSSVGRGRDKLRVHELISPASREVTQGHKELQNVTNTYKGTLTLLSRILESTIESSSRASTSTSKLLTNASLSSNMATVGNNDKLVDLSFAIAEKFRSLRNGTFRRGKEGVARGHVWGANFSLHGVRNYSATLGR